MQLIPVSSMNIPTVAQDAAAWRLAHPKHTMGLTSQMSQSLLPLLSALQRHLQGTFLSLERKAKWLALMQLQVCPAIHGTINLSKSLPFAAKLPSNISTVSGFRDRALLITTWLLCSPNAPKAAELRKYWNTGMHTAATLSDESITC